MNRSAALRRGSMEMPFPTSRIGVRRSCKVHSPNARPKLEVKAPRNWSAALRCGSMEMPFPTSRIGVRCSCKVHGPNARPKLEVKALPEAYSEKHNGRTFVRPFHTQDSFFHTAHTGYQQHALSIARTPVRASHQYWRQALAGSIPNATCYRTNA